jgi:hypothetical protein
VTALPKGLKFNAGHYIYPIEIVKRIKIDGRGRELAALQN